MKPLTASSEGIPLSGVACVGEASWLTAGLAAGAGFVGAAIAAASNRNTPRFFSISSFQEILGLCALLLITPPRSCLLAPGRQFGPFASDADISQLSKIFRSRGDVARRFR